MKNKKGAAKIIAFILILLIAILTVIILYNLIRDILEQRGEIVEIRSKLITEDIDIDNIELSQDQVNITISKGPGKIILKNITRTKRNASVDIVSVVDLSGSMGFCDENCDKDSCTGECDDCKICNAKDGNKVLIDEILDYSSDNRVGLVGYRSSVSASDCHSLSDNDKSLKDKASSWEAGGGTCICCGINKAVDILKEGKNKKQFIIVMSDGHATYECDEQGWTPDLNEDSNPDRPEDDAIQAAKEAHNKGIKVYTIGFGSNADEDALKKIAEEAGGKYYFSDTDNLKEIYNQTWIEIKRNYEAEEKWDHLKIIFYNATDSWTYEVHNVPAPLETKTYKIPEGKLSEKITNITEIRIYSIVYTEQGREVIGPVLDSWKYEFQ